MSIRKIILLVLLLWSGTMAKAQEVTRQESWWLRLYFQGKINEKWAWHLELDERRLTTPHSQLQFITHAHIHRKINPALEAALGGSFSVVSEVEEPRLFQELHWSIPVTNRFKIANRFRTEERFFHKNADDWDVRFRGRYRLQMAYWGTSHFAVKASDELLWQNTGFDQNRIYSALEYRCCNRFSIEAGYLKIWQKRNENQYFNRDILRVTLYMTI